MQACRQTWCLPIAVTAMTSYMSPAWGMML